MSTFYYIDAIPGAGKTEYFVNLAERHLRNGSKKILMYVAPTARLLHETLRRLSVRPGVRTKDIWMVLDNSRVTDWADPGYVPPSARWVRDQPATAINYLLGLMGQEDYDAAKYKRLYAKSCDRQLQAGDIVFTTHETFLRVRAAHKDSKLRDIHVVFDEARNCVLSSKAVTLPGREWKEFIPCIDLEDVDTSKKSSAKGWHVFLVKRIKSTQEVMQSFKVDKKSKIPEGIKDVIKLYEQSAKSGRTDMYMLAFEDLKDSVLSGDNKRVSVHITLRPTRLFSGYGRVTLTAAFLKYSQMYHFLKKEGNKFVDLTEKSDSPSIRSIVARSKSLQQGVKRRLRVAPLMPVVKTVDGKIKRQTLSSHMLLNNWVVPVDFQGKTPGSIYDSPPLWVMLREAGIIFDEWRKKHDSNLPLLTTINVDSGQKWQEGVRFLSVIHSIRAIGHLYAPVERQHFLRASEKTDIELTSPFWIDFFKKTLFDTSDKFEIPQSPSLYGVNSYSHLHAFAHLAALNPSPDLIKLYSSVLPDYDVDLDHSIDNLVQMLYRTNLRDPEGREPVLLIVPHHSTAMMLARKIGIDGFKIFKKPTMRVWFSPERMDENARKAASARGGLKSRKFKEGADSERARLSSALWRARKKYEASNSAQDAAKIRTLEQAVKDLKLKG
jgi:hypothetical protein